MSLALRNLEKMLNSNQESKLLHYCLGEEYLKQARFESAEKHLRQALHMDNRYCPAWKLLGKTLDTAGKHNEAVVAYEQGIQVAKTQGDIQALEEMMTFRQRIVLEHSRHL